MINRLVKFVLLSELFAVTTFGLGWWSVAVVAAVWGVAMARGSRPIAWATVCSTAGWAELLAISAARDPVGEVAFRLGGVMRVPGFALVTITILFAALLAWCGATLGVAAGKLRFAERAESVEQAELSPAQ
jgi:hypothetical protein